MSLTNFLQLMTFITGVCIGSFLNVVVLRGLSGESIAYPASKCPKCQNPLKWWHNIPIVSYIFLRGKCHFCKEKISIQYPIVELICGLFFLLTVIRFGFTLNTLFIFVFISLFIVLSVTDILEQVILDRHAYILGIFGLLYNGFNVGHYSGNLPPLVNSLLGLIVGMIAMELLARSGFLLAKTRAFGEGDTFIAAALGAIFGVPQILYILLGAIAIKVLFIIPIYFKKLYNLKDFKTIIYLITFFLVAIGVKALEYHEPLSGKLWVMILSFIILATLAILTCKRILTNIKNPDNQTYLPFGPALVISATIFLFA